MGDASHRIYVLARRVRWLDRLRHPIAVVLAVVLSPILMYLLRGALAAEWPIGPAIAPGVMLAVVLWWAVEAVFALVIAFWETEHDGLSRDVGLPTARLISRRRP